MSINKSKYRSLKKIPYGGSYMRLSFKEMCVVIPVTFILAFWVIPAIYAKSEKFDFASQENFRLKSDLRDDYWAYERWCSYAAGNFDVMFIGDSVVWGMYADRDSTLSGYYNAAKGANIAANLGIDGLHPVAMETLVRDFARPVRNKKVFLYFNALWMDDAKFDLSALPVKTEDGDYERFSVMHPRLIPQFDCSIYLYDEPFKKRMSNFLEQKIPMYSLLNHLRSTWYDNQPLPQWIMDHPNELNPFEPIGSVVKAAEKERKSVSGAWNEQSGYTVSFDWVMPYQSRQWEAFKRTCMVLEERGNEVIVLMGVFNTHMLESKSRSQFNKLLDFCAEDLEDMDVKYIWLEVPESEDFRDASHPLASGYEFMVDNIIDEEE